MQKNIHVFDAQNFRVISGANVGDTLNDAQEVSLDDVYILDELAPKLSLPLRIEKNDIFIAKGGDIGQFNNRVFIDSQMSFMCPMGNMIDVLVIVEVDKDNYIISTVFLPLAKLGPKIEYTLINVSQENTVNKFFQLSTASFARGTRLTLHDGTLKAVENLIPGDLLLTRNAGAKPVKWIGERTQRATGNLAPVCIKAGVLHNLGELLLSPENHIFIYQRQDLLKIGRAEVLIKAKDLINNDTVTQLKKGFIEYFQLLLDDHYIIYAEGIATESTRFDNNVHVENYFGNSGSESKPSDASILDLTYEKDDTDSTNLVNIIRQATFS